MKKIRVSITKIRNSYYAKIPDIIAKKMELSNHDDIEIRLYKKNFDDQVEIWERHPEDIDTIKFSITEEVHTMNMYNRIYIPAKYRFFFPSTGVDFIFETNMGNIRTHITSDGYFTQGMRQWFYTNGPLQPGDLLKIRSLDDKKYLFQLICEKKK